MRVLGIPTVLLDEHETILSSHQVQKYGGGEGSAREAAQE